MKNKKISEVLIESIDEYNKLKEQKILQNRKTHIRYRCKICGIECIKIFRPDRIMRLVCENHAKEETCMQKYGVKCHLLRKDFQDKAHQTIHLHASERQKNRENEKKKIQLLKQQIKIEKIVKEYGSIENYEKYNRLETPYQKMKFREIINHGSHENAQRIKVQHTQKTNMQKYGVKWCSQRPEVIEHIQQGNIRNFGVKWSFQAEKVKSKIKETKKKLYGDPKYRNENKIFKTCLKKYGSISPFGNKNIRQKIANANIRKIGVDNPFKLKTIQDKCRRKYTYNNINFDSAPEVAFYIWLNDVNDIIGVDFEYSPNIKFEYEYDGKKHFYMPDFRLGDCYVELKGDHFFNEDGQMINPFRDKSWTNEQYADECAKYEAKHQCMIKNRVIILKTADYQFFCDYVFEVYGKDFVFGFKNKQER